jgi:hypothetical protein
MKVINRFCMLAAFPVVLFVGINTNAQTASKNLPPTPVQDAVRSSAAFAELILRKAELESELEAFLMDYTEEFPRVIEIKHSLGLLEKAVARIMSAKPAETGKLTLALGKLLVRRVELETDVWKLLQSYKDEHPDVKRAIRRLEIYDAAIKEILG